MLIPPYTRYERLFVYHLDLPTLPRIDDPDLIGTWLEDGSAILFFHQDKKKLILDLCHEMGCAVIYQADLNYRDWESGREVTAFTVGPLTVAPVWDTSPADIRLDPSVVFGSGFHASTRLCLETLIKYLPTPEFHINTALDLGCGTGLLAIAAAKMGVGKISAVDHNLLSCKVAAQNIERNQVDSLVTVRQADLRTDLPDCRVDLVVANLYRELLVTLISTPSFWQASYYILAGFISGMEQDLLAALPEHQIRFIERRRKDRWCLWLLAKK